MIGVERTLCGSWSACSVALGLGEQMHTSSSACDPPALGRPGLGGELCASQEGCVQGTAPRRGKTKCPQRQEDEPTGRRGSGIFCVLWARRHPLLRWSIFLVEKAIFTAAADTERVLGTQLLRKLPGQVLAPWAPNSSASLVCTLPPSTRPRLLKFLRSANFRPTMLLKK